MVALDAVSVMASGTAAAPSTPVSLPVFWSSVVADALIGGLFLVVWAVALITIGVQDIVRLSESG